MGSRLIQLLMETAYIQSPADHSEDGPPDIRPAFVHNLKTIDTRCVYFYFFKICFFQTDREHERALHSY